MYSISVGDHHGREQDRPERYLPLLFSHKFSQMVILAVSKLTQDLGLEAMKFSSSAGVKSDKALAPSNTSQSVQQRQ